jgi:biotin carboxylase
MMSTPVAVVVDGYASGRFLPTAFAKLGVGAVHVQSSPEFIANLMAPALDAYQRNLICATAADLDTTLSALAGYRPVAVVAGAEYGVRLADILSERLGLATNGCRLSVARRDKYRMIETLSVAGLRCAEQFASEDPAGLVAWAQRHESYPVVVKPLSSSGTDNVYICHDAADVTKAADVILSSVDLFQETNNRAMVQSYLDGVEYVVDTVSANGRHYVCAVWEYEKTTTPAGRRIYDKVILRDPDSAPVPEVINYVDSVLDALHIRHGPAHAEVIVTEAGPVLVEIAARLNGGMEPTFQDRCVGANQADLTALAYARPDEFGREFGGRVYQKRADAIVHHTSTRLDGVVESVDQGVLDTIAALPTVHLVTPKLSPGKRIRPTVDLPTSPLRVYLIDGNPARLAEDCRAIGDVKDLVYRLAS